MPRKDLLWIVNLVSFALLLILAVTGLLNWLVIPRGAGAGRVVASLRHVLRDFHSWTAVAFCLATALHVWLHRGYVRQNLKRSGLLK